MLARRMLILVALALVLVGAAAPAAAQTEQPEHPIFAFYYPWYDPDSFGSRTAFQPDLANYNSDDRAVIERHLTQARDAGLDGFIVAWDGAGGRTDRNFRRILDRAGAHGMRATIYFETHNFTPQGPGAVIEQLTQFYASYILPDHPNLIRYQGRPVIFFWQTRLLDLADWEVIRAAVDPDQRAVWIAEGDIFAQLEGDTFQGIHPYSIAWSTTPGRHLASYGSRTHQYPDKLWIPTAMPGYDDTRITGWDDFIRDRGDGAYLTESFHGAVDSQPDWAILIASFNEWYEGHQIESAQEYGTLYLDLLRQLVDEFRAGA